MWTTMAGGSRESSTVSHAPRAAAWSFITTTGKEVQWHESKNTSALILLLSNKRPYQVYMYAGIPVKLVQAVYLCMQLDRARSAAIYIPMY